jgi:hypothetical protein
MHFMRLVCQPTKEQFERIAAEAETTHKATMRAPAMRFMATGVSVLRKPITDALLKSVRKVLSPEQAERYHKELELRNQALKRSVALNLVAKVDKFLILSPQQRRKLSKILQDHWQESWSELQMLMYGSQYFPQMPDAEISRILTDVQKEVWRGLTKAIVHFGFDLNRLNTDLGDEVWDEGRPPSPADADPATAKKKGRAGSGERK